MGQVRAPFPKNEIVHIRTRTSRKRGHENSRHTARDQLFRYAPGGRLAPLRQIEGPGAGQIVHWHSSRFAACIVAKVHDVNNIDIVSTDCQWHKAANKTM